MMKVAFLCLFSLYYLQCYSQQSDIIEENDIRHKVDQFFRALATKDTVLYQTIALPTGQIWTVRNTDGTLKYSTRTIGHDITRLASMKETIEERPLHYDIRIHQDIAIAWVPYTLNVSGEFSHCGIDVFTLLKTDQGWKIVSAAYSVEPDGCDVIKKDIPK